MDLDDCPAKESANIDLKVREAQVQLLYRQSWTGLGGVLTVSLTACVIFWQIIPHWKLYLWAGLIILLSLLRTVVSLAYLKRTASTSDIDRWANLHVAGIIGSGLLWAVPTFFLWPADISSYQLVWPICILPLSAAAVATYYSWTPSYIAFVLLTVLPLSLRFFYTEDFLHNILGFLSLFFLAVLLRAGKVMHDASVQALEFGIHNEALNIDLKEVVSAREQLNLQLQQKIAERAVAEREREKLIDELQAALEEIKTMKGVIPICMHCKGIRDDKGYWNILEKYVSEHSYAQFSHGICDDCMKTHYPELDD
jgi:hypothetical protein